MNLKTLGGRLRAARESLNLTQDDLRRVTGLSKGFVSDLEHDNRNPSAATICLLSDALKVSVEWLVRGKRTKAVKCPLCKGSGRMGFF